MKAQTLVPLAAAAAAQLLVVGNIAAAFAFQQKPPVETLVTVPVVAEIEQVECVRQDPVPYEPVTYQVPLDAELQSYTEKMCDLYDVPLELAYLQMSLLGMPGYVVIGDTLASPSTSYDKRGLLPVDNGSVWYTPMLRIPVWQYRIFMAQMELVTQPIKKEYAADAPKSEPQKALEATKKSKQPKDTEKPKAAKMPPKEPEQEPMFSEGKGGQLSFF